jgi:hypothetical protein
MDSRIAETLIHSPAREAEMARFDLTDFEWSVT